LDNDDKATLNLIADGSNLDSLTNAKVTRKAGVRLEGISNFISDKIYEFGHKIKIPASLISDKTQQISRSHLITAITYSYIRIKNKKAPRHHFINKAKGFSASSWFWSIKEQL